MSANSKNDAVSATIGSMLLKGHKMLGESCPTCNTVLMQDKKGVITCVNCEDSKQPNVNVVSTSMDTDQVQGLGHRLPRRGYSDGVPYRQSYLRGPPEEVSFVVEVLLKEIKAAADRLESGSGHSGDATEINQRLVQVNYIRQCAEAIKLLQEIDS